VQLIQVEKLVEASNPSLGNFTWIVNVQSINGWIESSVRSACKPVEILNSDQLKRLLEKGVVVKREEVGPTKIAVPGDELCEERQMRGHIRGASWRQAGIRKRQSTFGED
jgi:hypothetical protein